MLRIGCTLLIALGAVLWSGCDNLNCGPGTVELDQKCVPTNFPDGGPSLNCGHNTTEINGECIVVCDDVCGPNTDIQTGTTDAGAPFCFCEGRGGSGICEPPQCPAALPGGAICVSGCARYLVDPDTPSRFMETLLGDPGALPDATTYEVRVYDPLAFAADPINTQPLGTGEITPVDGTFVVRDIVVPGTNFLAVVVEDIEALGLDELVFAGFPYEATPGFNLEVIDAFAITETQNADWSANPNVDLAGTGCTSATFADCGTWVGVFGFREDGRLNILQDVEPLNNAAPIPFASSFFMLPSYDDFFAPADQSEAVTNGSGTVFFPGAVLGQFGGQCVDVSPDSECEQNAYTWNLTRLGGAVPTAIFIQIMNPEGVGE